MTERTQYTVVCILLSVNDSNMMLDPTNNGYYCIARHRLSGDWYMPLSCRIYWYWLPSSRRVGSRLLRRRFFWCDQISTVVSLPMLGLKHTVAGVLEACYGKLYAGHMQSRVTLTAGSKAIRRAWRVNYIDNEPREPRQPCTLVLAPFVSLHCMLAL